MRSPERRAVGTMYIINTSARWYNYNTVPYKSYCMLRNYISTLLARKANKVLTFSWSGPPGSISLVAGGDGPRSAQRIPLASATTSVSTSVRCFSRTRCVLDTTALLRSTVSPYIVLLSIRRDDAAIRLRASRTSADACGAINLGAAVTDGTASARA